MYVICTTVTTLLCQPGLELERDLHHGRSRVPSELASADVIDVSGSTGVSFSTGNLQKMWLPLVSKTSQAPNRHPQHKNPPQKTCDLPQKTLTRLGQGSLATFVRLDTSTGASTKLFFWATLVGVLCFPLKQPPFSELSPVSSGLRFNHPMIGLRNLSHGPTTLLIVGHDRLSPAKRRAFVLP